MTTTMKRETDNASMSEATMDQEAPTDASRLLKKHDTMVNPAVRTYYTHLL
jgi:hypothetical protein